MKLHDLKPAPGSRKRKKRVGRGISAGQGKTAGRGTKGQNARSGGGKPPYFEGGQLPLVRRLPYKRGFTNIFRVEYQEVNVEFLNDNFGHHSTITPTELMEVGLIRKKDEPVVILGRGDLRKKLTVYAHRFSRSAQDKITAAGGEFILIPQPVQGARATVKRLPKVQLEELYRQSIESVTPRQSAAVQAEILFDVEPDKKVILNKSYQVAISLVLSKKSFQETLVEYQDKKIIIDVLAKVNDKVQLTDDWKKELVGVVDTTNLISDPVIFTFIPIKTGQVVIEISLYHMTRWLSTHTEILFCVNGSQ